MSRRARERANARPWEQEEPEDERHAGDFPEYEPEQQERFPNTDDMFGESDAD